MANTDIMHTLGLLQGKVENLELQMRELREDYDHDDGGDAPAQNNTDVVEMFAKQLMGQFGNFKNPAQTSAPQVIEEADHGDNGLDPGPK